MMAYLQPVAQRRVEESPAPDDDHLGDHDPLAGPEDVRIGVQSIQMYDFPDLSIFDTLQWLRWTQSAYSSPVPYKSGLDRSIRLFKGGNREDQPWHAKS